ncbi:MAG: hypothetical protein ACWGSD_17610, partial [Thermodesulfobacteriota bacterium]
GFEGRLHIPNRLLRRYLRRRQKVDLLDLSTRPSDDPNRDDARKGRQQILSSLDGPARIGR